MANGRGHDSFAYSMSDLMAGVAVVFLLVAVIYMVRAARQAEAETRRGQEARQRLAEIDTGDENAKQELLRLRTELTNDPMLERVVTPIYEPTRDPFLLTLVFDRERLQFGVADCSIHEDVREAIRTTFARIFGAVCRANAAYIQSITLEGHTDRKPFFPESSNCGVQPSSYRCRHGEVSDECEQLGFANNVRLSAARAQNVFFEIQQIFGADAALRACVEQRFVVAGRGPVEALDGRDWRSEHSALEDDANRRVVLKIRATGRVGGGSRH